MFDAFAHKLTTLFPNLDWHFIYLHDQHDNVNNSDPHYTHKGAYTFINASTHPSEPDLALNIIDELEDFKQLEINPQEIKINKSTLNQKLYFSC